MTSQDANAKGAVAHIQTATTGTAHGGVFDRPINVMFIGLSSLF